MRWKAIQPDNPILRLEIKHQQRTVPRWLQWFDRFGVIVLALVISLALFLLPIKDDLYGSHSWLYPEIDIFLPLLLWIAQLLIILRCVFASVNTMHYHRGWKQWDVMVLTGMTRKQILIGKFWGTLYQLRGWMVAIGIINLAVAALVSTNLIVFCYRNPLEELRAEMSISPWMDIASYDYAMSLQAGDCPEPRTIGQIGLIVIHTIAISILATMVSTAVGLMGGLIGNQAIGFVVALTCRLAPVFIFTLFPDYPYAGGYIVWRWYEYTWFSFADGGATGILRAGIIWDPYPTMTIYPTLLAFWAAILMYIAYLVFAFLISNFLLRRQGVLSGSSK